MVPRGPSFGIGSAHAQNALADRKNARPSRDRACIARRPANSRYSPARLALRSAPSSELALRLFQRHENSAKSRCTMRCGMRWHRLCCRVNACSNEAWSVPSRELALNLFQLAFASTLTRRKGRLVLYLRIAPSRELALRINFAPAPRIIYESTLHNALRCVASNDARVDSHSIFAFLRIGFLRLITKNSIKIIKFAFRTLTLHKALCHPRGARAPRNVRESEAWRGQIAD